MLCLLSFCGAMGSPGRLFAGGSSLAMAQNGLPTGDYPPQDGRLSPMFVLLRAHYDEARERLEVQCHFAIGAIVAVYKNAAAARWAK